MSRFLKEMEEMKKLAMITVILLVVVLSFAEINLTELEAVENSVSEIIEEINSGNYDAALNEIAILRNAISKTEAQLRGLDFRGDRETLHGPVEMPAGVYKVYFKCQNGHVSVYDADGELTDNLIKSRSLPDYSTTVFKSPGETFIFDVYTTKEYHLYFEKIN